MCDFGIPVIGEVYEVGSLAADVDGRGLNFF